MGEPAIDDKKTVELELTPKSDAVKKQFSKVRLWLDPSSWLPVQQQFYETGSGDYSIAHYSHVVKNPKIPDSEFKPHWPKGTEKSSLRDKRTNEISPFYFLWVVHFRCTRSRTD